MAISRAVHRLLYILESELEPESENLFCIKQEIEEKLLILRLPKILFIF